MELAVVTPFPAVIPGNPCKLPFTKRRGWHAVLVAGTIDSVLPHVALTALSFLEGGACEDHVGHIVHYEGVFQWGALLWMKGFGDLDLPDAARHSAVEHGYLSSGHDGQEPEGNADDDGTTTTEFHGVGFVTDPTPLLSLTLDDFLT